MKFALHQNQIVRLDGFASPYLLHRLRLVNQTPRRQPNGFRLFPGKVLEIPGSEVEIFSESD